MNIQGSLGHLPPIRPVQTSSLSRATSSGKTSAALQFQQLLNQELHKQEDVRFSHHAQLRMKERGMSMTPDLMQKMKQAISQAESKGAKQSLVVVNKQAFIVNVHSRTVITALDEASQQDHIFTQIDSAVLMN
ncbi:flagellar operon protein [Paenibacillus sp. MER 180]|uniref:TIGR02530 family flagellar biosynthesis protein n=2 Tax=Paenibacillus TaxID=44249 RepID=A0AAJ2JYM1_9BACL|nr:MULTISPECIES: TIGR02530 family flagellar biosynthesis protein [unclassified Paenibacillus]MCM3291715.1 flagellar operon protein [Paenibacillus sp. MER 180]MDT8976747.1 TIGR02530 family flagellar biosynthesis protein [Paenibacillus sp. chi10]OBY79335.1 flagellar operon protein [Paenibacillus sp. KS1]TQR45799.1 flagellar operon protein [Paenibacillus sp. SDF0028]